MASVKLYLDIRSPRQNGTFPLKLAVTHKKFFLINLKVYFAREEWEREAIIHDNGEVLLPNRKADVAYINQRLSQARTILYQLAALGKLNKISDKELKEIIENNDIATIGEAKPILFKDRYEAYTSNMAKQNTLGTFVRMYNKVAAFSDIDSLTFEQMNVSWMKDFDAFLSGKNQNLSPNTRGIYLRNIRAIFNDAIDRDLIPMNLYPFRKFKIPKQATVKRSLTAKELVVLRDYPCDLYLEKYRDVFMLLFYLRGINTIDLAGLTEIVNGRIEYRRSKTGRLYSVEVLPEAQAIINKYRGTEHLLSFFDNRSNYRDFTLRMNKSLKKLGKVEIGKRGKKTITPIFPKISTYWARHTWATIASGLDIPKETIAAALGHGGNTVTDIYIDFDQKKVDEANRKIMAYLAEN
ncbi:tyrosine-type recombinase/integrase [Alistipes indistinctus]|uniref:tyrosine-type recombinase/integrase n=1 Tax=Alistipes indistinctus TaxID=626932 RepID=UPI003AF07B99